MEIEGLNKKPVILFFIEGCIATPEQIHQAENIPSATVYYRNAHEVGVHDALEKADGVFGAVPTKYEKYPTAEEAVKKYQDRLLSKKKASGDVEAPEVKPGPKKDFKEAVKASGKDK